jgi:hypothetical protein
MAQPVKSFDMELTYYLSGPMSGIEEYNYPAFTDAARMLRDSGVKIESPHENEWPVTSDVMTEAQLWEAMMWVAEAQLGRCQGVILMPGWCHSSGALRELGWAKERKLPVYFYDPSSHRITTMVRP